VALGENFLATCEGHTEKIHGTLLFWRNGGSDVKQFIGVCSNLNVDNRSCIASVTSTEYKEHKRFRVKSYYTNQIDCGFLHYVKSYLEISIVDWSDNGSYSCLSSGIFNNKTNAVPVDIIVG